MMRFTPCGFSLSALLFPTWSAVSLGTATEGDFTYTIPERLDRPGGVPDVVPNPTRSCETYKALVSTRRLQAAAETR